MCRLTQKQVCRMYVERILSAGDMDVLEMVIARSFVGHNPIQPEGFRGGTAYAAAAPAPRPPSPTGASRSRR